MASDLTERLAAAIKEHKTGECGCPQCLIEYAPVFLPLLLSEPELVAGLAPEAKREVLRQLLEAEIVDAGIHNETHRSCVLQTAHDILTGAANG